MVEDKVADGIRYIKRHSSHEHGVEKQAAVQKILKVIQLAGVCQQFVVRWATPKRVMKKIILGRKATKNRQKRK